MNEKQRVRLSKLLSRHLRHDPGGLGLTLEDGGWVTVDALLEGCRRAGVALSPDDLATIVETSDKQRFAFDETGARIRANQGHSVEVDLRLDLADPPSVLYHGTGAATVATVLADGLRKMRRHHVHLSPDVVTATRVGARHGQPIVLAVDAEAMARSGHTFYVSANGVWLTDEVPPEFLRIAEGSTA